MASIDDIIDEIANQRVVMNRQIGIISDIVEKSNNVLLQVEAENTLKSTNPKEKDLTCYAYKKETAHSLGKIIVEFQEMINKRAEEGNGNKQQENVTTTANSFEKFLQKNQQRTEYLGSSIRKLLALNDTIAKMKQDLANHVDETPEDFDYD